MNYIYTLVYSSYCKSEDGLYTEMVGIYKTKEDATKAMNDDIKIVDGQHYDDWNFHEYFAEYSDDEFTKHYVISQLIES